MDGPIGGAPPHALNLIHVKVRNDCDDRGRVHHGAHLPHEQLPRGGDDAEGGAPKKVSWHAPERGHLLPGTASAFVGRER